MAMSANANAGAFLLLVAAFILAVSTTTSANLNITKALEKYPKYSTLSNLLKKTKLTGAINKRQTTTILALDNDSIKLISSRPSDELRKILMNHIVLDYYDIKKIKSIKKKKSRLLTTLYQSTGQAKDQEGYVNMTKRKPGDVVFGSADKKAQLVSKLLGAVITQPFNLSVLHVSLPIIAPGFGDPVQAPPPPPRGSSKSPAGAPKKSKSKSKSKSGDAPSPSDEEEDDDREAHSPSPSPSASPSHSPSPSPSPSPSNRPAGSSKAAKEESPSKKDVADAEESPSKKDVPDAEESASSRIEWSRVGVAAAIGWLATLIAF